MDKIRLSVVVGQGSSVVDFKIDNPSIGYKVGDVINKRSYPRFWI